MYLSKDNTQAPKSSKKMIIAAATGLAVAGVATVGYMNQADQVDFENLASHDGMTLAYQFYNTV